MAGENNPTPTKGVPLVLDGVTYHLRCSLATRNRLIAEFGEEGLSKMKGEAIGKVVLEFMRGSTPDMTLEKLEEIIDMENLSDVVEAMVKAMGNRQKAKVDLVGEALPALEAATAAGVKAD